MTKYEHVFIGPYFIEGVVHAGQLIKTDIDSKLFLAFFMNYGISVTV
jgi:hypothetical protein